MASDQSRTVYCGNISPKLTEELLYELFLQAGPLESVTIPKDKNGEQRRFAFVTFRHECSVDYSIFLFQGTTLFDEELQLKRRNGTTALRDNERPVTYHQPIQNNQNFHFNPPFNQQYPQPTYYQQPSNMFVNQITTGVPMFNQPMRNVMDHNPQWNGNINNGMVSDQYSHRQEYSSSRNSYDTQRGDYQSNRRSHDYDRSSYEYEREHKRSRHSDYDHRERPSSYERRHHDRYSERNTHRYL